jgi:ABC-type Fe3+-hydroxamate transport system substrate-binding protein
MFPERIICLSAESADICAKLGAGNRIVGVGAFAPRELRQGRRVVGGFSTLKRDELLELAPDLVITFSDVQAEMSADLIRNHCTVLATNQRSLHRGNSAQILSSRWPAAFRPTLFGTLCSSRMSVFRGLSQPLLPESVASS